MAKPTGSFQYGPILSPSEENFKPGGGHDATSNAVENGLPGWPKGSSGVIDRVTLVNYGKFGKVKPESE